MLHNDRVTFGLLMARIHLKQSASDSTYSDEFQHLLRGQEGIVKDVAAIKVEGLKPQQIADMMRLCKLQAFRNLPKRVQNNPVCWLQSSRALNFK